MIGGEFRYLFGVVIAAALGGCSSKGAVAPRVQAADMDEGALLGAPSYAPLESVSVPITQLERKDVLAAIDAGLGRFLQKIEIEPSLTERGEFAGFRIVRVYDEQSFQGLGIGPGDIVTSVNQHPIERPTEAYEAFISLKTADYLEVDYLRGGRSMRLSLPIVGGAQVEPAPTAPAAHPDPKQDQPQKTQ